MSNRANTSYLLSTGKLLGLPLLVALLPVGGVVLRQAPLFSDTERAALQAYWNAAGRYSVSLPPDAAVKGAWQVRLTPDGSAWLLRYQNAIGARSVAPTVNPTTIGSNKEAWKTWVQARIGADRRIAQDAADAANGVLNHAISGKAGTDPPAPIGSAGPGPIPLTLLATVGNPPPFATAVTPMQYSVTFDDADAYTYVDNTPVPPTYAYYRFPQGVAVFGSHAADNELGTLFQAAGMSDTERRISTAVSKLEGSFESINTYDTGFVSVGFIQFITLDDGKHSLSEVLANEKQTRPDEFAHDFHRYGIDVTADGTIDVVDPATAAELTGPDAVRKLVDDKRLISVFQRAGRHSNAFRIAQIQVAKSHYWPSDDPIVISCCGLSITGKVSDVIRSEAGMATLFDRKVNRGTCEPITAVITKLMQDKGLTTLDQAADYERDIIKALKYRTDFLKDSSLSQPQ